MPDPTALPLSIPPAVADLARFALAAGQRAGMLPADYSLEDFLIDAVWERATLLATELALGFTQDCYRIDRQPCFYAGEGRLRHLAIFIV